MEVRKESSLQKESRILTGNSAIGYATKMVWHNRIPGMLPLEIRELNNEIQYVYDVTGRLSLQSYLQEHAITREFVVRLFTKVLICIEEGYSYLLRDQDYVLTLDMVFGTEDWENVELAHFEGYNRSVTEQLLIWVEDWMGRMDHRDRGLVELVYGIYHVCKERGSLQQLRELLSDDEPLCRENLSVQESRSIQKSLSMQESEFSKPTVRTGPDSISEVAVAETVYPVQIRNRCLLIAAVGILMIAVLGFGTNAFRYPTSGKIDFSRLGACFVVVSAIVGYLIYRMRDPAKKSIQEERPEEEATVLLGSLLSDEEEYILSAQQKEVYRDMDVVEFPFFIGKLKTKTNGQIPSREVSRYHAKIERDGEHYLLTDLGSMNGTFLNGIRLKAREPADLHENDIILFANVAYCFTRKTHFV